MNRNAPAHAALIRIAQALVAGALVATAAACQCPPPIPYDQVFALDATAGPPVDTSDAGGGGTPMTSDAGGDAMSMAPDASAGTGATSIAPAPQLDCTSAAQGCVPGATCKPACDCVLAREALSQRYESVTVKSCTLLAGPGAPQVEIRYNLASFCGGD
jgi:hypothetical protein